MSNQRCIGGRYVSASCEVRRTTAAANLNSTVCSLRPRVCFEVFFAVEGGQVYWATQLASEDQLATAYRIIQGMTLLTTIVLKRNFSKTVALVMLQVVSLEISR